MIDVFGFHIAMHSVSLGASRRFVMFNRNIIDRSR